MQLRRALLTLFALTSAVGCQAYSNVANGILNSGLLHATDGSVNIKNALSVPICKVTVFNDREPDRDGNELEGEKKVLLPGADGRATIPHFGKGSEPTPAGMKYGMKIYACKANATHPSDLEPGALVTTIPSITLHSSEPTIIH
jgi:hypothetical protein